MTDQHTNSKGGGILPYPDLAKAATKKNSTESPKTEQSELETQQTEAYPPDQLEEEAADSLQTEQSELETQQTETPLLDPDEGEQSTAYQDTNSKGNTYLSAILAPFRRGKNDGMFK